jgi:hypothetical protein
MVLYLRKRGMNEGTAEMIISNIKKLIIEIIIIGSCKFNFSLITANNLKLFSQKY